MRDRSTEPLVRAGLFPHSSICNHSLMRGSCLPHTCRGVGVPAGQMGQQP